MGCFTGDIDLKPGSEVSVQLADKNREREPKLRTKGGLNWFHRKEGLKAKILAKKTNACRHSGNHRSTSTLRLDPSTGFLLASPDMMALHVCILQCN